MAPELLLDVKLLRLLDQLHSTRSVTRAAEALGQSQPTVSIWLAQLRKQLDDPLVVRTPQGMMPTPRTDALIGTVREVLAGLERLGEAAAPFDPSGTRRRFRICMTDASHVTLRVAADDRGREQHGASPRFLGARKSSPNSRCRSSVSVRHAGAGRACVRVTGAGLHGAVHDASERFGRMHLDPLDVIPGSTRDPWIAGAETPDLLRHRKDTAWVIRFGVRTYEPFIAKANSNDRKSQPGSLTITSFVDASRGEWARYRHARAVRRKP